MKFGFRYRSGTSLIEVLVVIVVLLVGILSVIRLFPPGFLINQQTEQLTQASRLAQQEADRFTNSESTLPDFILPVEPVAGGFKVDLNATPDDLSDVTTGSFGVDPYYLSNVNKIRRVINEYVRIPVPSPMRGEVASVYVLSLGPIYNATFSDSNNNMTASLSISGAPLTRLTEDSSSAPFIRNPTQYAIDENQGMIAFYPNPGYVYTLSYSYNDANNVVQSIVNESFTVGAGSYPVWIPIPTLPSGATIVPDSETVARAFAQLAPGTAWSNDPYEFQLLSQDLPGTPGSFANMGVVAFNPLGHDYIEQSPTGPVPLTARISYNVLDWRVIHEDRPMPAGAPYQVQLTLKNVKHLDDFEANQTQYNGLFPLPAAHTQRVDVIVYNMTTGQSLTDLNPGSATFGQPMKDMTNVPIYTVTSYKDGLITFSDTFGKANASGTFRFFYKAQGDWALQVQKAANSYRRHIPYSDASVGLGEYFLGGPTASSQGVGKGYRIYFPLLDAGKSVTIRDMWFHTSPDPSSPVVHASNETYRINANSSMFETLPVQGGMRVLTWVDITSNHPNAVSWAPESTGQAVSGVQGISFKSRVLWTNGSTVDTSGSGNVVRTRWRKVDLDTFLTRPPQ